MSHTLAAAALLFAHAESAAQSLPEPQATTLQAPELPEDAAKCVPFVRERSSIQIYGDPWTWWEQAEGRYARGSTPRPGSVLVFPRSNRLKLGLVALVTTVIDKRVIRVALARPAGADLSCTPVATPLTLLDTSPTNDWTSIESVAPEGALARTPVYPGNGFVYGTAQTGRKDLTTNSPDSVGALIDAYGKSDLPICPGDRRCP